MSVVISSQNIVPAASSDQGLVSWHCGLLTPALCRSLHSEWSALAMSASEPNIFQSPTFVLNSIPLYGKPPPEILTIRVDGLLIGLIILRRDDGYAKLPVRFWRTALHPEQYLGTPLVRAGFEPAFVSGLCRWLDDAPAEFCFVKLSMVSADGPLAAALTDHCAGEGRGCLTANHLERAAISPHAHRDKRADELIRPSRRKTISKARKRLEQEGALSVERLVEAAQIEAWTAQFLAMEDSGWKHDEGSSILSCPHETRLYRAMIALAFDSGNLHFTRLCLNGQAIAYTLDIAAPPAGFCLKSAIDQRYRKFAPGILIEYETLAYYLAKDEFMLVDSCSAPDNALLNEMWPDRKIIFDIAVSRKGVGYDLIFKAMKQIKSWLSTKAAR